MPITDKNASAQFNKGKHHEMAAGAAMLAASAISLFKKLSSAKK